MRRASSDPGRPPAPSEVARVLLPTPFGEFMARAFECCSGFVYLALTRGDVAGGRGVLARVHSECLTGDALGSLRCDCGLQLRSALRAIAAEGRGVLVYVTGHEGRGIGLVNKLRAYLEQDRGADTLDANRRLGLAVDAREYREAAGVLQELGLASVRLLTNNPAKALALRAAGVDVESIEPIATAPHTRSLGYLRAKERRLGHVQPLGTPLEPLGPLPPPDASGLLGTVRPDPERPYVILKYAQTLDGRIATATGDSKWISGEPERMLSHALRAACDAVLVGVGTVLQDDPQLTVRLVPGASPLRVVLDSGLRTPPTAKVLSPEAATLVLTTDRAGPEQWRALQATGAGIRRVAAGPDGVHLPAALALLARSGVQTLLVEGGARVITSLLAAGLVDRIVVAVAPTIIGSGREAVGPLGTLRVTEGLRLLNRTVHLVGDDVLLAWDLTDSSQLSEATPNGSGASHHDPGSEAHPAALRPR